jgi:hypothetical protein
MIARPTPSIFTKPFLFLKKNIEAEEYLEEVKTKNGDAYCEMNISQQWIRTFDFSGNEKCCYQQK